MAGRDSKVNNFTSSLFFLLNIIRSGRLAEIRWSICMSKSHRSSCAPFSGTACWIVDIPFVLIVKFKFLAPLPVNHHDHPVVSSLYHFLCHLLHSLITWLIVLSQSQLNLYLLFFCVLSFLVLIRLVHMAFFSAAIRRDSVSLLRLPFLSYIQVFSYDMLLISCLKHSWSFFFAFVYIYIYIYIYNLHWNISL